VVGYEIEADLQLAMGGRDRPVHRASLLGRDVDVVLVVALQLVGLDERNLCAVRQRPRSITAHTLDAASGGRIAIGGNIVRKLGILPERIVLRTLLLDVPLSWVIGRGVRIV